MMHLFDLHGKTAIVTGSSRGIGKATALRLAEHGANVLVSSRKLEACRSAVDEINKAVGAERAHALAANISSKAELKGLVDAAVDRWGGLDILVCNAASNPYFGSILNIEDDVFRKVLDNNILSNNWLAQLASPHMKVRGEGAIIIISSIAGLRGSEVIGAYGISKAADLQLTRNLAVELGPANIRVNAIAPGLIKTDFARALWEDQERLSRRMDATPLRRIGDVDDIAGAVVFLASPAGRFLTGQTIVIDGGVSIAG